MIGADRGPVADDGGSREILVLAITTVERVLAVARSLRESRTAGEVSVAASRSDASRYRDAGFRTHVLGEREVAPDQLEAMLSRVASVVVPTGYPRQSLLRLARVLGRRGDGSAFLEVAGRTWSIRSCAGCMLWILAAASLPAQWLVTWAGRADGAGVLALLYLTRGAAVGSSPDGPVCHVIGGLGTGGAQRQLVEVLRHVARPLDDLRVVALFEDDGRFVEELEATGVASEIVYAALRKARWRHLLARAMPLTAVSLVLRRRLDDLRPRCVVSWLFVANVVTAAALGPRPAPHFVAGVRNLSEWKTWPEYRRWWLRAADRRTSRTASRLIANAEAVACDYGRWVGLPREQVTVVPNGVDVARVEAASLVPVPAIAGLTPGIPTLVAVGRLAREKNLGMLVECCRRFELSGRPVNLVVVGHGDLESELRAEITREGLGHRVFLTGGSDHPEAYIRLADLFVLGSRIEGMPNALLEAQALGRAAVTTAAGGAGEVIEHEVTGLVVPVDDVDAFTDAVRRLVEDADERSAMGRRAAARVARHFSIDSTAAMLDALTGRKREGLE